jgi:hypothetical protein
MYWQGYQGRFGVFHWPCYSLELHNLPIFDMSEWQSWKTGQPLANLLARLTDMYSTNVYLYAHSQGNVASGAALRLATNQVVNTYVASQAALSARAYDNTVPSNAAAFYSTLSSYRYNTPDSEGYYYTNGAESYFNSSIGAGRYANFFNTNDWALMGSSLIPVHPGWLKDQSSKPDGFAYYYYTTPITAIPFGYYYSYTGARQFQQAPNWTRVPLLFTTNTYQIFAMCCQSYSLALGAQEDVGLGSGPFSSALQVELDTAPWNFGNTLIYHDGQFTIDNMTVGPYWKTLLQTFRLKP